MQVFVYRNLTKKCWSVKDLKTGLVVAREKALFLKNCRFKVVESGRQRVIRKKCKNVHAGVVGEISDAHLCSERITYNPYLSPSFMTKTDMQPIDYAEYVEFCEDGQAFAALRSEPPEGHTSQGWLDIVGTESVTSPRR